MLGCCLIHLSPIRLSPSQALRYNQAARDVITGPSWLPAGSAGAHSVRGAILPAPQAEGRSAPATGPLTSPHRPASHLYRYVAHRGGDRLHLRGARQEQEGAVILRLSGAISPVRLLRPGASPLQATASSPSASPPAARAAAAPLQRPHIPASDVIPTAANRSNIRPRRPSRPRPDSATVDPGGPQRRRPLGPTQRQVTTPEPVALDGGPPR